MTLLHPDEALQRILASAQTLSETETVPLAAARGRVLAKPLTARCTLPPFDVSAMDGYACVVDTPDRRTPMRLKVIGESAAGHPFMGEPGHGEAVRVMTGAAVPRTANTIVLREQAEEDGARVVLHPPFEPGRHIRRKGLDFERGAPLLHPGVPLDARHIGLAAAMGHAGLAVLRRPKVAIIATGDELLEPGAPAGDGARVFSSNPSLAAAMISGAAGEALIIGTAGDSVASLTAALDAARDSRADIILTCGGVSAGARDLVPAALTRLGFRETFHGIALKPGKPCLFGSLGNQTVLGFPGNPVAVFVCSVVFLVPLLRRMLGLPAADNHERAVLAAAMPENGERRDYVRAAVVEDDSGILRAAPLPVQDSSMLTTLVAADGLIVREIDAPAAPEGSPAKVLRFARILR